MATARTFTSSNFMLTLDGVACGFATSAGGGDIVAEVIQENAVPAFFAKKHLGPIAYEDFAVQFGLGMAQAVYDWIAASWAGAFVRKDGSITTADQSFNAQLEQVFSGALLTETTISALDAAAKSPGTFTITFSPELTRTTKGSGKLPAAAGQKQKQWSASNFRLDLDGLDSSHVRKIDSFTVKQTVTANDVGDSRDIRKEAGKVEFPNLKVTMNDGPTAAGWLSWFEDFVIKGNSGEAQEKSGAIVFLGPDLKAELGRILLHNVGIFALRRPVQQAHADAVRFLTAELYCERMELQVGPPKPAPAPAKVVDPGRIIGIRR